MLPRTLEPEIMDTAEEAADYDTMDHGDVNRRFAEDALAAFARATGAVDGPARVLDLGAGTGLIALELAARSPGSHVLASDLGEHMLRHARANVARAGLEGRVEVARADAKALHFPDGVFDLVVTNSLVHHLPSPHEALREAWRVLAPGGVLFVRDLARPDDADAVEALVARYGVPSPDAARSAADAARDARQAELLRASLHAALTPDELAREAALAGVPSPGPARSSDRHVTLVARKA